MVIGGNGRHTKTGIPTPPANERSYNGNDRESTHMGEKTAIRILLFVASIVAPGYKDEIVSLSNHIQYNREA